MGKRVLGIVFVVMVAFWGSCSSLVGCQDKAEAPYQACQSAESKGNLEVGGKIV